MMLRSTLAKRVLLAAAALVALAASAQSSDPALAVRTDPGLGDHVVDGSGMTLYLFTPDAQGASTCVDACAENWPPFLADGDVAVAEGLDAALVGSVERADGTRQVTYGGWPLYAFVNDAAAGDTNGQGLNDAWFVVATDGTALGAAAMGGDATGGEDALFEALMNEGAGVFHTICAGCARRQRQPSARQPRRAPRRQRPPREPATRPPPRHPWQRLHARLRRHPLGPRSGCGSDLRPKLVRE